MSRKSGYWRGFAVGAVSAMAGAAAVATIRMAGGSLGVFGSRRGRRIVRLEKALQIGLPVEDVFRAWLEVAKVPDLSSIIGSQTRRSDHWHWRIALGDRDIEWDARVEQLIPNQAIGWKSLSGPKHTGRITFAPIGNNTLVQVTMNYAPRSFWMRGISASMKQRLEDYLDQVLRDFKAALEGKGQEHATRRGLQEQAVRTNLSSSSTGTHGSVHMHRPQNTRFAGPPNPLGGFTSSGS
jgi:uncharacterized membrane protein